ncbi:MAG: right-handed parallel beta-helix repeat-containing protein, partial [Candidatus Cloacimonadota bacterium]|nr:right-handed parallel beta-helix repeat-containing protein [Candidatus Cloacimonadota bacterium]
MKKNLMIFTVLYFTLFLLTNLNATDVSGDQSGTWLPENNPYNIIGEITVPSGDSLEIQAGVNVIAQGNYRITALGNILAFGTFSDSILFCGAEGIFWGGIRLENENVQSEFYHCHISNTNDDNDYGISAVNSPIFINHCTLNDHKKAVHFFGLPSANPAYMEMKNSKISNCELNGILITDNSNVLIDSCEITQCGLGTQFRGAIQLALQLSSHSCSPTITHSWIHHNGKQGITMGNLFNYDDMSPTVNYNDVSFNLTGMYLYNAKGFYRNNFIHDNYIENDPNTGAGVMLYGSGANAVFTENNVTGNYTGFFLQNNATANLGNLNNADPNDDGWNLIHDNIFYDGTVYSVVNMSS